MNTNQKNIDWSSYINFEQRRLQSNKGYQDKEGHHVMIKGSILQDDIIFNVQMPINRASNC